MLLSALKIQLDLKRDTAQIRWFTAWLAVSVFLGFLLLFWNRFFPIQEGWFHFYAKLIADGKVPYRDFYLFLQPLYPLQFVALYSLGSDQFIFSRVMGLAERSLLLIALYTWLSSLFPIRWALLGTLTAMAVFSSNTTDVIYSYYQVALVFCIAAGFMANKFLLAPEGNHYQILLCGLLASLG